MPDGTIVICYADTVTTKFGRDFKNITFHPEVFKEIGRHTKPCGIFIDSMSDLFGEKVESDWIKQVVECMSRFPQHRFFTLTKNPRRLLDFVFPDNAIVGVSIPPSFMYGKELTPDQQRSWMSCALTWLERADCKTRWISAEPLSFDVASLIEHAKFDWIVIGAGSNGRVKYQPNIDHFDAVLKVARRRGMPVFFKGNIDRDMAIQCGGWRSEFPKL